MTPRDKALSHAAAFRSHLLAAEGELATGLALAREHGHTGAVEALEALQDRLEKAHHKANAAARAVADAMGDDPEVYSGGSADDKNEPDPQP